MKQDERARRFKKLADAIRLEQQAVAKRLGLSPPYLSLLKSGAKPLTETIARAMEDNFGVRASWLRGGEPPMLADPHKAAEHVDFGLLPRAWVDDYSYYLMLQQMGGGEGGLGFLLLDSFSPGLPAVSAGVESSRVLLPHPQGGTLYCVKATEEFGPAFRRGDHLLIEHLTPAEWTPEALDGKVCVARLEGSGDWGLFFLRLSRETAPRKVLLLSVSNSNARWRPVEWSNLEILGRLLFSFCLAFHPQMQAWEQTELFAGQESPDCSAD